MGVKPAKGRVEYAESIRYVCHCGKSKGFYIEGTFEGSKTLLPSGQEQGGRFTGSFHPSGPVRCLGCQQPATDLQASSDT